MLLESSAVLLACLTKILLNIDLAVHSFVALVALDRNRMAVMPSVLCSGRIFMH